MAVEVSHIEEVSGGGKNGKKGVDSSICQRANWASISINERERGVL